MESRTVPRTVSQSISHISFKYKSFSLIDSPRDCMTNICRTLCSETKCLETVCFVSVNVFNKRVSEMRVPLAVGFVANQLGV